MLAVLGVACFLSLDAISMPREFTFAFAGVFVGAALRDIGIARRSVVLWDIQRDFIDWPKVEQTARELGIERRTAEPYADHGRPTPRAD